MFMKKTATDSMNYYSGTGSEREWE